MSTQKQGSFGTYLAIIAAFITFVAKVLLPYTLDISLLSWFLLRAEGAAELAAALAFLLCAVQVFSAFRARAFRRVTIAGVGLVIAGAVLVPTLIAIVLALAMASGGAIPR